MIGLHFAEQAMFLLGQARNEHQTALHSVLFALGFLRDGILSAAGPEAAADFDLTMLQAISHIVKTDTETLQRLLTEKRQ